MEGKKLQKHLGRLPKYSKKFSEGRDLPFFS